MDHAAPFASKNTPPNYLQVDHRVPYSIAGDIAELAAEDFMLLCGACNRAKSWTCEHCPNQQKKSTTTCQTCYWAHPLEYAHIAMQTVRRIEIVWTDDEIAQYERLKARADANHETLAQFIKAVLARHFRDRD